MNEEQIIITLSPEQLIALDKLAKMAGAESTVIFARQILLSTLGIEPQAQSDKILLPVSDINSTVNNLQRLHKDLKAFVAESIASMKNESIEVENESEQNKSDRNKSEKAKEKTIENDAGFDQVKNELEEFAQQITNKKDPLDELLKTEDIINKKEAKLDSKQESVLKEETETDAEDEEAIDENYTFDVPLTLTNNKNKNKSKTIKQKNLPGMVSTDKPEANPGMPATIPSGVIPPPQRKQK